MHAEHSTVELGVVTVRSGAFTRTPKREADVASQSADTIKLSFRTNCFEMASGLIRPVPAAKYWPVLTPSGLI